MDNDDDGFGRSNRFGNSDDDSYDDDDYSESDDNLEYGDEGNFDTTFINQPLANGQTQSHVEGVDSSM